MTRTGAVTIAGVCCLVAGVVVGQLLPPRVERICLEGSGINSSAFLASGYLMTAVADLRKVDLTADTVRTKVRVNDADELEAVIRAIQNGYRRN